MEIKTCITVACAYAGINQRELSRRTGISVQTISKLVNGKQNCTLGTMKLISTACGFKVSEFVQFGEGGNKSTGTSGISTTKHH